MIIKIEFSESTLGYQDTDSIDVQKSLNQFKESLENHLQFEYPLAKITVVKSDFDRVTVNFMTDHKEIGAIQDIIGKVWNGDGWLIYSTIRCSVCDFELGNAADLEQQVENAPQGYDTPTDYGLDPNDVTWLCGHHTEETGEWNEEIPYWHD
jgi:hypothetical protein